MSEHAQPAIEARPEPTMLETELDSMCLSLTKMKSRLRRMPLLEHMTEAERVQLSASLARAEARLFELSAIIRGKSTQMPD